MLAANICYFLFLVIIFVQVFKLISVQIHKEMQKILIFVFFIMKTE